MLIHFKGLHSWSVKLTKNIIFRKYANTFIFIFNSILFYNFNELAIVKCLAFETICLGYASLK